MFPDKKNQFYLNATGDIAGNTLNLVNNITGQPKNDKGTRTVLGIAYSQYVKFGLDLRNNTKLTRKTQLAAHMVVGVGIPYGNSEALPFLKSYFSGGASSVRAFPVNSLGPGTYHLPDSLRNNYFFQQGGDIKLEWSIEYRFPIVSVLKAAGVGFGLRADLSFFIIRLDLATPVRKPWLPEGQRYVLNDFYLGSPEWRRNNLILNIAIGYPF